MRSFSLTGRDARLAVQNQIPTRDPRGDHPFLWTCLRTLKTTAPPSDVNRLQRPFWLLRNIDFSFPPFRYGSNPCLNLCLTPFAWPSIVLQTLFQTSLDDEAHMPVNISARTEILEPLPSPISHNAVRFDPLGQRVEHICSNAAWSSV